MTECPFKYIYYPQKEHYNEYGQRWHTDDKKKKYNACALTGLPIIKCVGEDKCPIMKK